MARRPSTSGRYLVDAEDKISQSMVARRTQIRSAEMHRPCEPELPRQRRCRTAAVPSLAVLRQSAIFEPRYSVTEVRTQAKIGPANRAFARPPNRLADALKNTRKIPLIQ